MEVYLSAAIPTHIPHENNEANKFVCFFFSYVLLLPTATVLKNLNGLCTRDTKIFDTYISLSLY